MQSHALNLQWLPLPITPTPNFQLCIQCPLQNDLHLSFDSGPTPPHKKHPPLSKLCTFMNSNFILFFSHLPLFQGLAQMFLLIGSCLTLSSLMVGLVSYSFFFCLKISVCSIFIIEIRNLLVSQVVKYHDDTVLVSQPTFSRHSSDLHESHSAVGGNPLGLEGYHY